MSTPTVRVDCPACDAELRAVPDGTPDDGRLTGTDVECDRCGRCIDVFHY